MLIFALFCYLGLFAWNARTGYLDTVAERSGLEIVRYVLSPIMVAQDAVTGVWDDYIALVDVAQENKRLRTELKKAQQLIILATEEKAELNRLRELFGIEALRDLSGFGARTIAKRFGPQAVLKTMAVDKGYVNGAVVGTPVIAPAGVVGRVYRTAPHAATVLLITDPGFRVAVISQTSRTPGIVKGLPGDSGQLEVTYVAQNANIAIGELLITAGVDGVFPKGLPVGVVTQVEPGHEILFQKVTAEPIVNLQHLEEVVLLQPIGSGAPLIERPVVAPLDPALEGAEGGPVSVPPTAPHSAASSASPATAGTPLPVAPAQTPLRQQGRVNSTRTSNALVTVPPTGRASQQPVGSEASTPATARIQPAPLDGMQQPLTTTNRLRRAAQDLSRRPASEPQPAPRGQ